jgi:hypothetical protein
MPAEGWYRDRFELHSDRWFSNGRPTALVRDGHQEGQDAPPDETFPGPLVEAITPTGVKGDDLKRADAAESGAAYDPKKAREAAIDAIPWGPIT